MSKSPSRTSTVVESVSRRPPSTAEKLGKILSGRTVDEALAGRFWPSARVLLVPGAIFVAGMTLTLLAYTLEHDSRRDEAVAGFERRAEALAGSIEEQFRTPFELVRLVSLLFSASETVTRAEFRRFAQPILERNPGIAYVFWMPLVTRDEVPELTERIRAEGAEAFRVWERDESGNVVVAPPRPEYLPVVYVEPLEPARLGVNLLDDRTPAAGRARATGQTAVTRPRHLAGDPEDVLSIVLLKPVLSPVDPDSTETIYVSRTANSDRGRLEGIVGFAVRIDDIIGASKAAQGADDLLVDVVDLDETIYTNSAGIAASTLAAGFVWSETFDLLDLSWELTVRPAPGASWAEIAPSFGLLVGGMLGSLLAAIVAFASRRVVQLRGEVESAIELGHYRLGRLLGEGGMGVVHQAKHRMLASPAAIKLIRPETLAEAGDAGVAKQILARFEREARATALLRSPHTISIYDFGVSTGGAFYYVMELLDGVDLETLVIEHGTLPAERVVHLLRQACKSLAEAHESGLIHRDIKPANLFTCRLGVDHDFVKVLDFGLVRGHLLGEGETRLTQAGRVVGTPDFMAPEMAMDAQDVDGRADLYALGCVAYWLLTAQPVFENESAVSLLMMHVKDEPVPPSAVTEIGVPADLERIVLDCLAKRPDERPATALELEQRLAACACANDWTQDRARKWWRLHRPE